MLLWRIPGTSSGTCSRSSALLDFGFSTRDTAIAHRDHRGVVMHTHSAKQDALHAIEQLPDDVPLDEIVYQLYVLNKVQQGLKDIDAGRTISADELTREIEAW